MIVLSYLDLNDWKLFSRVNSVCNGVVSPLLWRYYTISWEEGNNIADLMINVNALARNPERARGLVRLRIVCGWKWTRNLEEAFAVIFDNLPNLTTLGITIPSTPRLTIGGELGPIAQMLDERKSRFNLELFIWDHVTFPNSPIVSFLRSQTRLRQLHAPRMFETRPIILAPNTFSNLRALSLPYPHTADLFISAAPRISRLVFLREGHGPILTFPLPWTSTTLKEIEFTPPEGTDWLKDLAASCPNLESMRLEAKIQYSPDYAHFKSLKNLSFASSYFTLYSPLFGNAQIPRRLAEFPSSVMKVEIRDIPVRWIRYGTTYHPSSSFPFFTLGD